MKGKLPGFFAFCILLGVMTFLAGREEAHAAEAQGYAMESAVLDEGKSGRGAVVAISEEGGIVIEGIEAAQIMVSISKAGDAESAQRAVTVVVHTNAMEWKEMSPTEPQAITIKLQGPEATAKEPEITPEEPEGTPEEPGERAEEPEITPEEPEATPVEPGERAEEPEITPEEPEATPVEPGERAEEPEITPEEPEGTPKEPQKPGVSGKAGDLAKRMQMILADDVQKAYGDKAFLLGARADGGGALSYEVKDPRIASVDEEGFVTIKGCGVTEIQIAAAANGEYAAAEETVLLTVAPKKLNRILAKKKSP